MLQLSQRVPLTTKIHHRRNLPSAKITHLPHCVPKTTTAPQRPENPEAASESEDGDQPSDGINAVNNSDKEAYQDPNGFTVAQIHHFARENSDRFHGDDRPAEMSAIVA